MGLQAALVLSGPEGGLSPAEEAAARPEGRALDVVQPQPPQRARYCERIETAARGQRAVRLCLQRRQQPADDEDA